MTPEEIQLLSVLEAIAADSHVSQRDLAQATGINLARVNYLLRRLVDKGSVKLGNISRNPNKLRYLYNLTPRGMAEKSQLTVRFVRRTWQQYNDTLRTLRESLARLKASGARRVLLLGDTEVTQMVLEAAEGLVGFTVVGILDPGGGGRLRGGIEVIGEVDGCEFDAAIPCGDWGESPEELAERLGIPSDRVWLG